MSDDAYLPLKQLAMYAGLSVRTLRGYINYPARPLPFYRVGGRILVRRSEFDAWATQFKTERKAVGVDTLVDDIVNGMR